MSKVGTYLPAHQKMNLSMVCLIGRHDFGCHTSHLCLVGTHLLEGGSCTRPPSTACARYAYKFQVDKSFPFNCNPRNWQHLTSAFKIQTELQFPFSSGWQTNFDAEFRCKVNCENSALTTSCNQK